MSRDSERLNHLAFNIKPGSVQFQRRSGGTNTKPAPRPNRARHGGFISGTFDSAISRAEKYISERLEAVADSAQGYYLDFTLRPNEWSVLKSLDASGIELISAKETQEGGNIVATAFVPKRKANAFRNKIEAYIKEDTTPRERKDGTFGESKPKNAKLVEAIDKIDLSPLISLWQDNPKDFPELAEKIWWEVWLTNSPERQDVFLTAAEEIGLSIKRGTLIFPDRSVIMIGADASQMNELRWRSGAIAELRRVKLNSSFFMALSNVEQVEWIDDLKGRVSISESPQARICLFDTGVNNGHELLGGFISDDDMDAYDAGWPLNDIGNQNHGTMMAGLATFGDLGPLLESTGLVEVNHRLESVRIIPPAGSNPPHLYGVIVKESVARIETKQPEKLRSFCMAITSDELMSRGKPSSWSAAIDQICFNAEIHDESRVFVVSAGNVRDLSSCNNYIDKCDVSQVEDPAQAWNAITVGAHTEKNAILDSSFDGWTPVADIGALSPVSRTSQMWQRQNWPIKPEIVMEGGNWAQSPDPNINYWDNTDDLSLLTTHHEPTNRQFGVISGTSASTALASKLIAEVQNQYPEMWAETVRGLVVHSARWTPRMQEAIDSCNGSKTAQANWLRRFGYGVPSNEAAIWSASNELTILIESEIQPFKYSGRGDPKINEMHLHKLPWPVEKLLALGTADVRLKATLSYFVQPNPSERGNRNKFTYQSHGLRFALKRAGETLEAFNRRINKAHGSGEGTVGGNFGQEDNWVIGPATRDVGSVHSDIWDGSATDLADREAIAIYPVGGWWYHLKSHGRANTKTKYSLVMSIEVPGHEVDLYTSVKSIIDTRIAAEIASVVQT